MSSSSFRAALRERASSSFRFAQTQTKKMRRDGVAKTVQAATGQVGRAYDYVLDSCEDFAKEWRQLQGGHSQLSRWGISRHEMDVIRKRPSSEAMRNVQTGEISSRFNQEQAKREAEAMYKLPLAERHQYMRARSKYGAMNSTLADQKQVSRKEYDKFKSKWTLVFVGVLGVSYFGGTYYAQWSYQWESDLRHQNSLRNPHLGAGWGRRKDDSEFELVT
ncbi:unnamed protein product [Amoebophrya sp. A25]|nr:unnamed protein product [Amoebophrya sp. A25]|eukprot:GSA25T00011074001.1